MSEELIKRLRRAAKRLDVPRYTHDAALLSEAANALEARPAPAVQVPEGVLRRVERIVFDCDASNGKQTGGYLSIGDLRSLKAAIESMPAKAGTATPYTGRDQELIDSLWSGVAANVATEARRERAIPPGMYQDAEGNVPARIGDPVALVVQADPFARQAVATEPVAQGNRSAVAQSGGVDVEKVMALVEELSDALAARLGTNAEEWVVVDKARALLNEAIAALESRPAPVPATMATEVEARVAELEAELQERLRTNCATLKQRNDALDRIAALESQLAEARTELEKETAQSKHLAEAMSRKIQELIAAENQCAYYKGQYTRTEQVRKEACEANAKAQAKTLWLEGELAASREREGRMREALQNLLRETHEPSCYHVHHAKRDQHEYIEACPVIQRHRTAVGRAVAALAAKKGEE